MTSSETTVTYHSTTPNILVRIAWFFLVGWWAAFAWINIAWALNATILLLPLGLWMINRVPLVLTLQTDSTVVERGIRRGEPVWRERTVMQESFLIRALWFLIIGWWLSFAWANIGWFLCATVIGLPFGIWMLNRLPAVTTLRRS